VSDRNTLALAYFGTASATWTKRMTSLTPDLELGQPIRVSLEDPLQVKLLDLAFEPRRET